eukprot:Nitzschia sp. Nitz4//scaffold92_size79448//45341//46756//NITZ4_005395-RA/size79448-processed-gene-0.58-mRNA-1//1//CDS//3329560198//5343//frame0
MATMQQQEESLRSIITEKPKNAKVVAQLSTLLLQQYKQLDESQATEKERLRNEAISLARKAIDIGPKRPFGYTALSTASWDTSERFDALRKAIELSEANEQFHFAKISLMIRLLIEPRLEEARTVKGEVGRANKQHPNRRNLSSQELDLYRRISSELQLVWNGISKEGQNDNSSLLSIEQKELLSAQEFRLGQFFRKKHPSTDNIPRSRYHFRQCQQYPQSTNSEMASFWLATLGTEGDVAVSTENPGHALLQKCPSDYVIGLYSTFAENFDELLVEKLNYQTPDKLRRLVDRLSVESALSAGRQLERCCDLGCGTGLSGLAFQSMVQSLVGVDLSPHMVEKARKRNCYEKLIVGDVTSAFGQEEHEVYDLVIACDVFCYIGDLSGVFNSVHNCLPKGGLFCFSTELLEQDGTSQDYALHECARFSHRRQYIERLADATGFLVLALDIDSIRKNKGQDVKGILAVLTPKES